MHRKRIPEAPIRDLTVAAPLKRWNSSDDAGTPPRYPRPDGRGPIEARPGDRELTCQKRGAIRDLTVAAPLKP